MAATNLRQSLEFSCLLRNVSLVAMDRLVDCLRIDGSLGAARLACRDLRDAVDGSVAEVHVKVLPGDDELNILAKLPSLERWPRCTSLTVTVSKAAACAAGRDGATSLLLLPFTRLPLERRRTITRLKCEVEGLELVEASPVSSLALWLPCLRELQLHSVRLACDPLDMWLMHQALATLTQLEVLTLPSCHALEGIGGLCSGGSCSVRHLEVWEAADCNAKDCSSVQPHLLEGLPQLRGLERLVLISYGSANGSFNTEACVALLTTDLPPSLESLELRARPSAGDGLTIAVNLQHGNMHSVRISTKLTLKYFLQLADEMLLPGLTPAGQEPEWPIRWPPPQPQAQVDLLHIEALEVSQGFVLDNDSRYTLFALKRRFRHIRAGTLGIGVCVDSRLAEAQLHTARRLACTVRAAHALQVSIAAHVMGGSTPALRSRCLTFSYVLSASAECSAAADRQDIKEDRQEEPGGKGAAAAPVEALHAARGFSWWPPAWKSFDDFTSLNASEFLQAALDRMVQAAAAEAEAEAQFVMAENGGGASDSERMEVVLLRGPLVESLCQAPGAVGPWLRMLEEVLASPVCGSCSDVECRPAGPFSAGKHSADKHIRGYQLLPTVNALLLACNQRAKHGLVAAAAEAAALHRGGLSVEDEVGKGAALEVAPLSVKWRWDDFDELDEACPPVAPLQEWLLHNVAQVIQTWWLDKAATMKSHWEDVFLLQALKCAFALRNGLINVLPPAVMLR